MKKEQELYVSLCRNLFPHCKLMELRPCDGAASAASANVCRMLQENAQEIARALFSEIECNGSAKTLRAVSCSRVW